MSQSWFLKVIFAHRILTLPAIISSRHDFFQIKIARLRQTLHLQLKVNSFDCFFGVFCMYFSHVLYLGNVVGSLHFDIHLGKFLLLSRLYTFGFGNLDMFHLLKPL